jgi:hypothetical protein
MAAGSAPVRFVTLEMAYRENEVLNAEVAAFNWEPQVCGGSWEAAKKARLSATPN